MGINNTLNIKEVFSESGSYCILDVMTHSLRPPKYHVAPLTSILAPVERAGRVDRCVDQISPQLAVRPRGAGKRDHVDTLNNFITLVDDR